MLTKSIAIVYDEVDLVNLFQDALEVNGFKVSSFTSPIEAFDKLQKSLEEYTIIISDYRMPTMNGDELCAKLMSLNPNLKFILISAYEDVECDTSKFTFLHKPISIARLLEIVKENLIQ